MSSFIWQQIANGCRVLLSGRIKSSLQEGSARHTFSQGHSVFATHTEQYSNLFSSSFFFLFLPPPQVLSLVVTVWIALTSVSFHNGLHSAGNRNIAQVGSSILKIVIVEKQKAMCVHNFVIINCMLI